MLEFGFLFSLGVVLLGLSADRVLRYGGVVAMLLVAAGIGYSSWLFAGVASGYVLLTFWMRERPGPRLLDWSRRAIWLVVSAGLMTHSLPGYEGLLLADQRMLKEGSLVSSLYFNHDKVLVAWSLLSWFPLFGRSGTSITLSPGRTSLLLMTGLASTMGLGVVLGLVDWRPGIPLVFWSFAFANLFNTCIAEELLFRGLVQGRLSLHLGGVSALLAAGALFGLVHLAGGWQFVILATVAGWLYGLAYAATGRLIWAVVVHWLLNLCHILLFTYPASAP